MHDIYSIEIKHSWPTIVKRIHEFIVLNSINNGKSSVSLYKIIDANISYWVENRGALNLYQYQSDIGVGSYVNNLVTQITDEKCLLYIQTTILQLLWLKSVNFKDEVGNHIRSRCDTLLRNIESYLDSNNYKMHIDSGSNRVYLMKRDVNVDSAVQSIESVDVQNDILRYIDFQTSKDLVMKQSIIARLHKYIENPSNKPLENNRVLVKNESKEINPISVFRDINDKFDIRHFQKEIHKVNGFVITDEKELHELCDIAFYMFIEAIRIPKMIEYSSKYLEYKSKYLPNK